MRSIIAVAVLAALIPFAGSSCRNFECGDFDNTCSALPLVFQQVVVEAGNSTWLTFLGAAVCKPRIRPSAIKMPRP